MAKLFRPMLLAGVAALLTAGGPTARAAEPETLRVAMQFGIAYLPLIVMEHDHLWEAKAHALGTDITVDYRQLGGGAALNDALLSGSVDLVAGGTAPMLVAWDRTVGSFNVKGIAALNASPMDVLTNKPSIVTLMDFGPDDRIAVPSIRVSAQAIALMAAAEKAFGPGQASRLDSLTVAMQHPDALAALVAGGGTIAGYVSSSPFQEEALKYPAVHRITDSFAAFGGPGTLAVVYGKASFETREPKVAQAFHQALEQAVASIKADHSAAITKYIDVTHDHTNRALLEAILARPDFTFGTAPQGTVKMAQFMRKIGLLKHDPKSARDFFVETQNGQPGN
jgi:NitT/TauT family transport system substrate-binding protein